MPSAVESTFPGPSWATAVVECPRSHDFSLSPTPGAAVDPLRSAHDPTAFPLPPRGAVVVPPSAICPRSHAFSLSPTPGGLGCSCPSAICPRSHAFSLSPTPGGLCSCPSGICPRSHGFSLSPTPGGLCSCPSAICPRSHAFSLSPTPGGLCSCPSAICPRSHGFSLSLTPGAGAGAGAGAGGRGWAAAVAECPRSQSSPSPPTPGGCSSAHGACGSWPSGESIRPRSIRFIDGPQDLAPWKPCSESVRGGGGGGAYALHLSVSCWIAAPLSVSQDSAARPILSVPLHA